MKSFPELWNLHFNNSWILSRVHRTNTSKTSFRKSSKESVFARFPIFERERASFSWKLRPLKFTRRRICADEHTDSFSRVQAGEGKSSGSAFISGVAFLSSDKKGSFILSFHCLTVLVCWGKVGEWQEAIAQRWVVLAWNYSAWERNSISAGKRSEGGRKVKWRKFQSSLNPPKIIALWLFPSPPCGDNGCRVEGR